MGKIRFNITKDGLSFSKGKGKLSVPIDREVKYCPTCKNLHPITKDGYEYLDCMLYIKQRDGKRFSDGSVHSLEKKMDKRIDRLTRVFPINIDEMDIIFEETIIVDKKEVTDEILKT